MNGADDIAPPPAERMEICRGENVGWFVRHDNTVVACFSNARDLAAWIEEICAPLDPQPQPREQMPAVLAGDDPQPQRRSLWAVISGGRS